MSQYFYRSLPQIIAQKALDAPDYCAQMQKDGEGNFVATTYAQLATSISEFSAGLLSLGVERGWKIALISDNCQRWLVASMGIMATGACDVPRGKDVSEQDLIHIVGRCECSIVVAENDYVYRKVAACIGSLPSVAHIILMSDGEVDKSFMKLSEGRVVETHKFSDISKIGREALAAGECLTDKLSLFTKHASDTAGGLDEEDLATIIFTSGTTGLPKGACLTHKNFLSQVDCVAKLLPLKLGNKALSVLPVWHVYEREMEYILLHIGVALCYSKPLPPVIMADLKKERIYFMAAVPRIWDALYKAIQKQFGCDKRTRWLAFKTWVALSRFHTFRVVARMFVFKNARKVFGKHFKLGISGGGALAHKLDRFFNRIGVNLIEAYGLTETAPLCTLRNYKKNAFGTIGRVLPCCSAKVLNSSGAQCKVGEKGVLYIKGDNVMSGYYKDKELTNEAISDGWFCTGDIVLITKDKNVIIKGRQKDTIVLRSGENVEPLPIENKLLESPFIAQAVIVGQDKNALGALIVPQKDAIIKYVAAMGSKQLGEELDVSNTQAVLKSEAVKSLMFKEFSSLITSKNGFKAYEKIGRFTFLDKPFEVGVELSAKQDIIRPKISELYKWQIKAMFSDTALLQNISNISGSLSNFANLDNVKNAVDSIKGAIIRKEQNADKKE